MTATDVPFLLAALLAGAAWVMKEVFDRCEAADDAELLGIMLDEQSN